MIERIEGNSVTEFDSHKNYGHREFKPKVEPYDPSKPLEDPLDIWPILRTFQETARRFQLRTAIRAKNAENEEAYDIITPIPMRNGEIPPNFPETMDDLRRLSIEEIDELLRLYDIARRPAHDATRRRIFSGFLGCRTYC
ncbi:hypothetical protein SISSUDRAFT_1125988 [Sistotremastrum suecicum HHB10207 ss-3]|uniref:Uncharacterized protein n=1 Tax=Sistotremastrum suecicum HHB10207 ss-3 TaxID=1314776 RepID=A0A166GVK6_9AGAM|nr:hypothetical protein SISSUDRAFT_1125988 [Sistotremastrum suecicum HHB10207 ss-3]